MQSLDGSGLAFFVKVLLDVGIGHEGADLSEYASVDPEHFDVAIDAELVEVGVSLVELCNCLVLCELLPKAHPQRVAEVQQVL